MGGSYFSAILGPNPYTGKVELEKETVLSRKKSWMSKLAEKKTSWFFSTGDFNNCCDLQ